MPEVKRTDVAADLERLYSKIDNKVAKYGPLSSADIKQAIRSSRRKKLPKVGINRILSPFR